MKNYKLIFTTALVVTLLSSVSCKKILEVDLPNNQLVTNAVFADSSNAVSAISGIYSELMGLSTIPSVGNGLITIYTGLTGDELFPTGVNASDNEFYLNAISPDNGNNYNFWLQSYRIIYQANACLDGLTNSTGLSSSLRNQLVGECKFLRSFLYFNLANLFGDVPYATNIDYNNNAKLARIDKDTLFGILIGDLLDAKELLAENYVSAQRVRANKMVVAALLAKIYLYREQWPQAELHSSMVIESPQYILESNLLNVFLANSKEAIWQLRPIQPGYNTAEGQLFNPSAAASIRPKYALTNSLLNAFEANDKRRVNDTWMKLKVVSGQSFYYPYKYKLRSDNNNNNPAEYYMVFRLPDLLLIRAEARVQQNKISNGLGDINLVRQRAGLPILSTTDKQQLLDQIFHERRIELFAEWGQRWFDLHRAKKANAVLGITKAPNWQPHDSLFPIPFSELQRNPFLVQNAGY